MSDFLESFILPKKPFEVVSIPNPLSKSLQGKYFVGQTESLAFSNTTNAWGVLNNPIGSGVNLFANAYTISNFSDKPFLVQIWFNTTQPGTGTLSTKISPADTALIPPPVPKVQLQYNQNVGGIPVGGVNVFDRIVSPGATLATEEDGTLRPHKELLPAFKTGSNSANFVLFFHCPLDGCTALLLLKAYLTFSDTTTYGAPHPK